MRSQGGFLLFSTRAAGVHNRTALTAKSQQPVRQHRRGASASSFSSQYPSLPLPHPHPHTTNCNISCQTGSRCGSTTTTNNNNNSNALGVHQKKTTSFLMRTIRRSSSACERRSFTAAVTPIRHTSTAATAKKVKKSTSPPERIVKADQRAAARSSAHISNKKKKTIAAARENGTTEPIKAKPLTKANVALFKMNDEEIPETNNSNSHNNNNNEEEDEYGGIVFTEVDNTAFDTYDQLIQDEKSKQTGNQSMDSDDDADDMAGVTISDGAINYSELFGQDILRHEGIHFESAEEEAEDGKEKGASHPSGGHSQAQSKATITTNSNSGVDRSANSDNTGEEDEEDKSDGGVKHGWQRIQQQQQENGSDDYESLVVDPFTPNLESDSSLGALDASSSSASSSSSSQGRRMDPEREAILSFTDMLCDDLYYCKTDVLRSFARTRRIGGKSKAEVVMKLIEAADRDAHGTGTDLSITKRVLGDVFSDDVRTSGRRSAWTNQSLEASHVEMACDRHLRFELMANTQKTLMVRRNAAEAARVLRKLSRPFQQKYEVTAKRAVGGVYRAYKAEADEIVASCSTAEVLSPFAAFLVSAVRYGQTMNLLTRANVNERLVELELVRPLLVEENEDTALQQLMSLLDSVVDEVTERQACFGEKRLNWGQDTAPVLVTAARALCEGGALHAAEWNTELAPAWAQDLARMFDNWESVVRSDLPSLSDVPRHFFNCILGGVASYALLQRLYGDLIGPRDISLHVRASLKAALTDHFSDADRATVVLGELLSYVLAGGSHTGEVRGGVRGEFFVAVLAQMQGAFHEQRGLGSGGGGGGAVTTAAAAQRHHDRIAVVLRETTLTASRCTRSCGLMPLLVKLTEDLRFHLRFQRVFKRLTAADRKTVRTRSSLNMIKTLEYFEGQFALTPVSTKAAAFLAIQLVYLALQPEHGRRAVLERYSSVTGRPELDIVGLSEVAATHVRDLRIAFPPQLSYRSWLSESDTKDKSVYTVLPSVAVKGSANQAMLVSQAPMMRALDAISRVPWRINRYMLHVQEAIVREGFGFGKIRPGFYPLHYTRLRRGDVHYASSGGSNYDGNDEDDEDEEEDSVVFNLAERAAYDRQQDADWKELSELRSSRIHYLQALRQARSIVDFSHLYFPNSMDFRGRMYPLPGRLNHTGSDPFRALLEFAEPKPLGAVGLYWLKVHLANKMGANKLSFDERVHYVDEHIADVVSSAENPLSGEGWWREASEPLQCLMACKELHDALRWPQGPEEFPSRLPVAVDGSYNGLQHYSAIGRDALGAKLVNLVPSERPADAYTGILKEMLTAIHADAAGDHPVAKLCLGTGRGQDHNHIKRKTIKRPIMTQVYGVTGYGMSEQILDELVKQNRGHGLWTTTDMKEMAAYLRTKVLDSLGVTFSETQNCRRWIDDTVRLLWEVQPAELRTALCWTTPLGLVVRQPYTVKKELPLFTAHGYTRVPGEAAAPASRKQLTAVAPNLIHSLDAAHLAMTALEMQRLGLPMAAVHDSYWSHACDLPVLSSVLRTQFVNLYTAHDPLEEVREQWTECFYRDLRRHGRTIPPPPPRGTLDLQVVLDSPYFFS